MSHRWRSDQCVGQDKTAVGSRPYRRFLRTAIRFPIGTLSPPVNLLAERVIVIPERGRHRALTADSPLEQAASALREVILAGEQYRHVVASHLGLTISESQAVSYLFSRGAMGQSELGEALGFNTSSTTALVDRLERNAIAERVAHPTDRRRSTVQLSVAGRKTVAAATGWIVRAFDNIDAAALPELARTLHALADDLRGQTARIPAPPNSQTSPRRRR